MHSVPLEGELRNSPARHAGDLHNCAESLPLLQYYTVCANNQQSKKAQLSKKILLEKKQNHE